MKFSYKVIVLLLITTIVFGGALTFISYKTSNISIKRNAEKNLEQLVVNEGERINYSIEEVEKLSLILREIVKSTIDEERLGEVGYMEEYKKEVSSLVLATINAYENKSGWIVFNPKVVRGGHIISFFQNEEGKYQREPDYNVYEIGSHTDSWWKNAIKNGENWTDPYYWEPWDANIVTYSIPIIIDNQLVAVCGAEFYFEDLKERIASIEVYDTGYMVLMNSTYDILYHPDSVVKNLLKLEKGSLRFIAEEIEKKGEEVGLVEYTYKNEEKVMAFKKLSNGWIISANPIEREIFKGLYKLRRDMIMGLVIGVIIIFGLAILLSRAIDSMTEDLAHIDEINKNIKKLHQKIKIEE